MVITFAGALQQDTAYCVHLNTELFSCADGSLLLRDTITVESLFTVTARSRVVSTGAAIFSALTMDV